MFQVRVSCPGGFSEAPLPPSWGGPAGVTPGEGDAAGLPLRSRRVHLHRPTPFVGQKSRRGGRRRGPGRGAGPEALAPRRKESPSGVGVEDAGAGLPRTQEALGMGDNFQLPGESLGPQSPGSPRGIRVPRGPGPGKPRGRRRGQRARARMVPAPSGWFGRRAPPGIPSAAAEPVRSGKLRPAPGHPAQHYPPVPGSGPAPPTPVRPPTSGEGAGGPRAPRPGPPPDGPAGLPLTTETWRPGPGRRRSGARGSQLWAPRLGDGGRGRGRGGREQRPGRAPAATFLFPAAGGGAGRGRGRPGALTPSAPPALPPLGRTASALHRGQRQWPISRRRNPRPDPEWPSRDFGAHEGHSRPRILDSPPRSFPGVVGPSGRV